MRTVICLKTILDPEIVEFDIDREELRNKILILDPIGDNLLEEGLSVRPMLANKLISARLDDTQQFSRRYSTKLSGTR